MIYMVIYVIMNVGIFVFILLMEKDGMFVSKIDVLNMYGSCESGKVLVMLIFLFFLVGVLLLVGFFGKFYVLCVVYDVGLVWLVVVGVIVLVIGVFYYLWIVYFMYFGED